MFNRSIETMSRDEMRALQLRRVCDTVAWTYERVPFYRNRLQEAGIAPGDIRTLSDFASVPFTVKDHLRQHYPYGLFAVPMQEIVRVHASSGTTGKPTVVGYTRDDLDMWSEAVARLCVAAGASDQDIAQIAFGYGLFTGALGLHQGLERVGAAIVPISSGNTERQIQLMHDFEVTLLVATPSYAMYLAETAERMGLMQHIHLQWGLFGAEGSSNEMREELERRWGIVATENYGLSEVLGPGVSGECIHKCGMHINEDFFYCEIIDPDTGVVLPDGEQGELVITPILKKGFPLLRYRTGDITRLLTSPCACGRTSTRMEKVAGRTDDMLIIRGVNVFPSQIESVLMADEGIGPHYEIIVTRTGYLDQLEVRCEMIDSSLLDLYHELEAVQERIKRKLRTILQIDATVTLVSPNTLKRFEGKAKRVTDQRERV